MIAVSRESLIAVPVPCVCLSRSSLNMKLLVLATVFLIQLASIIEVNAEVFDAETKANYAECLGSLLVVTEREVKIRFNLSRTRTRFKAASLQVEGCGCFDLYKKKNYRGTVWHISHYMGNLSGDNIGFPVKSVKKVPCEEYGQHPWLLKRMVTRDVNRRRRHRGHRRGQMFQVPTIESVMP